MDDVQFWDPAKSEVEKLPGQLVIACGRPSIMREAHWHAQVEVNYVFSGELHYQMEGYRLTLEPGQIALFWGGQPHRLFAVRGEASYQAIHLPLFDFFRLRLPSSMIAQIMRGSTVRACANLAEDDPAFRRRGEWMASSAPHLLTHAIDELLLRLERLGFEAHDMLHGSEVEAAASHRRGGGDLVQRLCSFVTQNFREDIDCAEIAAFADVHPKYAMTVFKKSTGMSLLDYLTLLRVSYAQALLTENRQSILQVAMESGFGSVSAFNKCFRKRAGMNPTEFKLRQRLQPPAVIASVLGVI